MFVHLRLHTEFSVVDSTISPRDAVAAAASDLQCALAITDLGNLFGAVKFYKAARSKGVKPLIGAEISLEIPDEGGTSVGRVLLLCASHAGYLNLCEILSLVWLNPASSYASIAWSDFEKYSDGLILLCGASAGNVGQALLAGDLPRAKRLAGRFLDLFGNRFYVEIQRAGRANDEEHLGLALGLAHDLDLPVVATHPIQFLAEDDFDAHEVRVCISEGELLGDEKRERRFTGQQFFKSQAQMEELFSDIPAAIENSVEIAKRCNVSIRLGHAQLPIFPLPEGHTTESYFRQVCQSGLEYRLLQLFRTPEAIEAKRDVYQQRLDFEIKTILQMGFPGYFLIVGDFIEWAKNNGCPVGPGRGSGAGSLVAYALKITDLDPLEYNLLFERFLNPERVSMPDFDIDFCQGNRDRVIDYVKDRYGRGAVSQIATFGTMAARAAIRDVGRVMELGYGFCDGISKLIPNKPGKPVTLQNPPPDVSGEEREKYALLAEPLLKERMEKEEEVRELIEMAQKLEGLTRNIGMHAGGVLIAPNKLTDFCPLYQQVGSDSAVSQYDKNDVEDVGLVKFDFLGLATLTILEKARSFIKARHAGQENFQFEDIDLKDEATYRLFQEGKTEAVFQFESRGMQAMLKDALPSRLEDLIALNALYRPGPMDLIPSFIARKHGRENVEYPHPLLEGVLSETYGIMVYQEQVMQTAQILGGYSLGGADLLRRAMGKKKPEEMAKQRVNFRKGAVEQGISEAKADEVFDLMEKFAGYGFNKSHAAAYSLLAYHTAWVKVHYPSEFFCANMTIEMDNTDKLKMLYEDAIRQGLFFEMPDVNKSSWGFEPAGDKNIIYGLGAIKGTGKAAIEAIISARESEGAFKSFFDFCKRVDKSKVNKRTIEALIKAGAFDEIEKNRAALIASIEIGAEYAATAQAGATQGGLFDNMEDGYGASWQEPEMPKISPWKVKERLQNEKSALGFYLSGHLFDEVAGEVRKFCKRPISEFLDSRESQIFAGIITNFRLITGLKGVMALFTLDDKTGQMDVKIDGQLLANIRKTNPDMLKDDEFLVVDGKISLDRFSGNRQLNAAQAWDMTGARASFGRYIEIKLGNKRPNLQKLLPSNKLTQNGLQIKIKLNAQNQKIKLKDLEIMLGANYKITPDDKELETLSEQIGEKIEVFYS